jgi:hypothetical protein
MRCAHPEVSREETRPARPAPTARAGWALVARSLVALAVLSSLAFLPPAAVAEDDGTPRLSFGAFGTLGLVYSTEHEADFVWNPTRPEGPGHSARVSPDDPLFDGFRAFGPEGRAIAERFEVDDTPFHFAAVGAEYDPGEWFVLAEVGWIGSNSVLGEKLAGYVTGGRRTGSITSHVTYSRSELLSVSSVPGLSLTGLPPPLVPVAAGLNAGLNALLRGSAVQQNLAAGGRWDFATGMALKLQFDFIDVLDDSPGTFTNQQPGFEPGRSAQLVSLATVFVF